MLYECNCQDIESRVATGASRRIRSNVENYIKLLRTWASNGLYAKDEENDTLYLCICKDVNTYLHLLQ